MKVNLDDVINAIESLNSGYTYYYITAEERIVPIADNDLKNLDYDESEMIRLPDRDDVDDYGNMERFIARVEDETIAEWLSNAIKGRGAFRMFRAALERFHMLNEWYDYRDRAHRVCAMDWCEENGIEYEGPRYEIEEDYDDDYDDYDADEDWDAKPAAPAVKQPEKPEYKIVSIGKRNVNQLVFLASAFIDERLISMGGQALDDPDEAGERLAAKLGEGCLMHALSDHGRFVGYVIESGAKDFFTIDEIYVRKELRRKGLGRKLLIQAEKDAEETKKPLQFDVDPSDHDALAFFAKCGYAVLNSVRIEKGTANAAENNVKISGLPFAVK